RSATSVSCAANAGWSPPRCYASKRSSMRHGIWASISAGCSVEASIVRREPSRSRTLGDARSRQSRKKPLPQSAFAQVELDGQHDHGNAGVLQATLDQEGAFVVQRAVPQRVFLEDDLPGDNQRFWIPLDRIIGQFFGLDGDLCPDAERCRRRIA